LGRLARRTGYCWDRLVGCGRTTFVEVERDAARRNIWTFVHVLLRIVAGWRGLAHTAAVSASDVDDYLAALPEPKRTTLEGMRRRILEIVPRC
jgi:hypothetical protein